MTHLSAQFKAKTSERSYTALVWGNIGRQRHQDENIGRHPKNRLQNTVLKPIKPIKENLRLLILRFWNVWVMLLLYDANLKQAVRTKFGYI